jgi:hypothetical protein
MKKLAISALLFAASLSAADYSGIWNGKGGKQDVRYGTVPMTAQMTLLQAGSNFSGTLSLGGGAAMPFTSGTVSGSQLVFSIVNGKAQLNGTLSGSASQLTGKVTDSVGNTFTLVFTKN